ncbi:MAG TPA: hypothetical protein VHY37_08125, partial [Tepidisphaeraceae bacterium]|nr:hypothetical protein [Tepidisphaeraceae bacterium]
MQLQDQQTTLLSKADQMAQDLLRDQFKNAKVALFTSHAPSSAAGPERLVSSTQLLSQWTPLKPQAESAPLVDRIADAAELLKEQPGDEKWLVVISDFQKREFPHAPTDFNAGRLILIDLHPKEARSAGIVRVAIDPPQATAGIGSDVVVDVLGQPGKTRPVNLAIDTPDGRQLLGAAAQIANLDSSGRARLRFPIRLPAERWMLLKASLGDQDDMPWDDQRQTLVEIPPVQLVDVLSDSSPEIADPQRFIRLALDPSEGTFAGWPLKVQSTASLTNATNVAVVTLAAWPDAARASRLAEFARRGGTVILFLRPGLAETWKSAPADVKADLAPLLPGDPLIDSSVSDANTVIAPDPATAAADPVLAGLTDKAFNLSAISVRRIVSFIPTADDVSALLWITATDPGPNSRPHGLLYRRPVGAGLAYTIATLPTDEFTNLATHPIFLPLLVRMSLRSADKTELLNTELGHPISVVGSDALGISELRLHGPGGEVIAVKPTTVDGRPAFVYDTPTEPGVYSWTPPPPADDKTYAMTNVQLPASESDLYYAPAETLLDPADNLVIAHNLAELSGKFAKLSEPQPKWTIPVALVLGLLCVEAFMGSTAKLWKPISLRAFFPKISPTAASPSQPPLSPTP